MDGFETAEIIQKNKKTQNTPIIFITAINKEEKDIKFLLVTNSKEVMEEIVSTGLDSKENIVYLAEKYPAVRALCEGKFSMHYMLPEEFIRLRKLETLKRRMKALGMMFTALAIMLAMLLVSFGVNRNLSIRLKDLRIEETSLNEALTSSYRAKYKDILRSGNMVDISRYAVSFIVWLPSEYKVESISVKKDPKGSYSFEAILSSQTKDNPLSGFGLPRIFRKAKVENVLIKNRPGLKVVMDIF